MTIAVPTQLQQLLSRWGEALGASIKDMGSFQG